MRRVPAVSKGHWLDEIPHHTIASVANEIAFEQRQREYWLKREKEGTVHQDKDRRAAARRGAEANRRKWQP